MEKLNFTVTFTCDRHGNTATTTVALSPLVPVMERENVIKIILRQTHEVATDVYIHGSRKQRIWTNIEAGLTDEYEGVAPGY